MKRLLNKVHSQSCSGTPLQFLDPPGPITGLWSHPGSGNTWMRYLIEQATGKITGSVYKVMIRRHVQTWKISLVRKIHCCAVED